MIAGVAGVPYYLLVFLAESARVALGLLIKRFRSFLSLAYGIILYLVASIFIVAL